MTPLRAISTVLALTALAACSSSSGEPTEVATTDGGGEITISAACAADTRKDLYSAGLTKPASDFSVQMTDSTFLPSGKPPQPGQVQEGMNAVTVLVLDQSQAPVDGATVKLTLLMPDHGHGSALTPTVAPLGGGKYQISNVWLSMAGLWQFTISILPTNGTLKEAVYNFCIDG